jgi:hypothetical protein
MPTLDENGYIPKEVVARHDNWLGAAVACGVDPRDVWEREQAVESLQETLSWLIEDAKEYMNELAMELELNHWSQPNRIARLGRNVRDVWAQFMAATEQARRLIEEK